ncbi:MAG: Fic family protein, partial [Clostridia bacterium]|nr:Fic family protein [Clostridia bacterium]
RNAWSDMLGALYYPLDERFVRQLAHRLTDEMEGHAGDYRQTDTHTIAAMGGESYDVPSSAAIPGLMQEYYAFLGSTEVHPLIKAAVGQAFLLIARPFPDGNERLSRMISYAVLLRSGYDFFRDISISAVIAKEGYRYYKSMQDVIRSESDGDLTYFIEYYLDLLARSIDEKAEQEQRRQRDALLRERKLAATPLGRDRPPEKEPRASAPDEDTQTEAAAENAGNEELPLLPDESPPVQLYTYEEYLSLLHDTRKKHMSRIQPERVERLCSRLEEFARNGPHVFRRAQWAELTGIPLGISKEDVFLMNKFGLIFCENIDESRSRAIKIYRIPLIPGERQPEPEAPPEDAGIRATLKLMLNSEYSRERQVAAGLLDMLDQGKQEFDYAEWNSRNPATSKDSGFAVLRVGLNRGLIEFDEGTYRIVSRVKSGPQCYPMPDKQRDVLLRLMDAFPNEWFTVRDAAEAAGSKYSTTGYYLENFTQRGILKVEKKPGNVNRYEFSNEVHGIFESLETDGETTRFQEQPLLQKEIHDPMQGMADAG